MPCLARRCVSTNLQLWLSTILTSAASFAGCFRRCCCWISPGAGRPCFFSDSCKELFCRAQQVWHTFLSANARSFTPLTRLEVGRRLRSGQRIPAEETFFSVDRTLLEFFELEKTSKHGVSGLSACTER